MKNYTIAFFEGGKVNEPFLRHYTKFIDLEDAEDYCRKAAKALSKEKAVSIGFTVHSRDQVSSALP